MRSLYAYIAYRIGPGPDAEDLTCDTLERALRYRSSYDPEKGEPIAWLIGIARHLIGTRASGASPAGDLPGEAASGDLEAETVERLTISAAVAELDERDRELIALHYGADLSPRRIAELLDVRMNTIEVALHRARERLRARLEDGGAPELSRSDPVRGVSI